MYTIIRYIKTVYHCLRYSPAQIRKTYLYNFGINKNKNKLWFIKNINEREKIDTKMRTVAKDLVDLALGGYLDLWKYYPTGAIALILILDQIARHVYRGDDNKIIQCNHKACQITTYILLQKWMIVDNDEFVSENYTYLDAKFILFPFRHSDNLEYLEIAANWGDVICKGEQNDLAFSERWTQLGIKKYNSTLRKIGIDSNHSILQNNGSKDHSNFRNDPFIFKLYKILHSYKGSIILSLSGGVDSMVLLHTLVSNSIPIICIYINYQVRGESDREEEYLRKLCKELEVELIVKKVECEPNIKDWDKITRKIRFETYRSVAEKFKDSRVLVGHHKGDICENALGNIIRGTCINLAGMQEVEQNDGVMIWRPYLTWCFKDEIEFISRKYKIEHFQDTSNPSCTRIMIRNLLTNLNKIRPDSYNNLYRASQESQELSKNIMNSINDTSESRAVLSPTSSSRSFKIDNINKFSYIELKYILEKICHSSGVGKIRDKSVRSFLDTISTFVKKDRKIQLVHLRKNVKAELLNIDSRISLNITFI